MIPSAPLAKLTESPELIVLLEVSAAHIQRFPDELASYRPQCVTVPHPADGVVKLIAELFEVTPPVPLEAEVLPADCVPAHSVMFAVTDARAYEPPETSVPPAESLHELVNSATYQVAGNAGVD